MDMVSIRTIHFIINNISIDSLFFSHYDTHCSEYLDDLKERLTSNTNDIVKLKVDLTLPTNTQKVFRNYGPNSRMVNIYMLKIPMIEWR